MAVAWQPTLLDLEAPSLDLDVPVTRTWLDERCWVDQGVGFLRSSGRLFDQLAASLPWRQTTRVVWEQEHLEPRLTSGRLPVPLPGVIDEARVLLSARYGVDLDACSANLYRDGRDSATGCTGCSPIRWWSPCPSATGGRSWSVPTAAARRPGSSRVTATSW